MEVGQALSAMEAALPEQPVGPYREALVLLQEVAPAMPASTVHEQLDRAFPAGRTPFQAFDDRPVAAASVGQVHRATWSDGTPVAVKVQYPSAGEALVADLRMLEKLAPVISAAAPGLDARQLLAELRARLVEEVDYVREAAAQMAFADAYRGDPDIAVPDVLAAEDRVLVTRWVGGTPLSRVIATGTRADRDRAGTLLLRLLASATVRARRLHGDPHPGNVQLLPDGRLAVLDFGATEDMPHGWPARLGPLLAAGRDGDAAALHRIAASAGLLRPDQVTDDALLDLLDPLPAAAAHPGPPVRPAWLQEQTRRASDPFGAVARTQHRLAVPPRHLLPSRVASGLVGVLYSLDATVAADAEVRRWLPGYGSTSPSAHLP